MEKETNIFKKTGTENTIKPTSKDYLNEFRRESALIQPQLNKDEITEEKSSSPATQEEIEKVVEKINKELGL